MKMKDEELTLLQLRICLEGGHCFLEGLTSIESELSGNALVDSMHFIKEKFITAIGILDEISAVPKKAVSAAR